MNYSQTYKVKIPADVQPGDTFAVSIEGVSSHINIRCPEDQRPGGLIELKVYTNSNIGYTSHDISPSSNNTASVPVYDMYGLSWNHSKVTLYWWVVLDLLLFCLLISAILLPTFSTQQLSLGCSSSGYLNPTPLYYSIWRGIGTDINCSTKNGNYCIYWNNRQAWKFIDSITHSQMEYSSSYIVAIQVSYTICLLYSIIVTYYLY